MSSNAFSNTDLQTWRDALNARVESGGIPGLVALVSHDERTEVVSAGVKETGKPARVERDTIFRISSLTKPVTAVAALMLIEDGRLSLDQSIDALLPELRNRCVLKRLEASLDETVPAHRPIAVRDLLTLRMGFGQLAAKPDAYPILKEANALGIGMGPPAPGKMPTPDEWLKRLGSLPLMRQPGESWHYNTASDVLGVLVARASGQTLAGFFNERIFGPLGMKDTGFYVPEKNQQRFAACYWPDEKTGAMTLFDPPQGGQWNQPPAFESGAGGLVSTADDYLAFAKLLMNKGDARPHRLIAAELVQEMTRNQLSPQQQKDGAQFLDGQGWGYGTGVSTTADNVATVPGQYGWFGGLGSVWRSDPAKQFIGILLTNAAFTSPEAPSVAEEFWNLGWRAALDRNSR